MKKADNRQLLSIDFPTLIALMLVLALLSGCQGGAGGEATGPDPGIIDYPIAYVKRPYALDANDEVVDQDLRDPLYFAEGGDLYLRDWSSLSANEINITRSVTGGQGDVKDVDVSYDGNRLVFSLRLFDDNPNTPPTPRWNLYEYDIPAKRLTKLMSDNIAELGDDLDPHYLPDGRIVFTSDRQVQSKSILTTENVLKPIFSSVDEDEGTKALVLHVGDVIEQQNGNFMPLSGIKQISFNQSHDLDPVVLSNGEILFTRWENAGPGGGAMHLYKMKPDGTDLQLVYGGNSHDTGTNGSTIQFMQPRPMSNGRVMALIKPFTDTFDGGDIVEIDVGTYIDNDQALAFYQGSLTGPAQRPVTVNTILTDGSPSPGGRYSAAYPLQDGTNRILVSKSFCNLLVNTVERPCIEPYISDPTAEELPPEYSIWMYDMNGDSEKPVVTTEDGLVMTDVVVAQSRPFPTVNISTIDTSLESEGVGILHIKSVYDFDGTFSSLGGPATDLTSMATSGFAADDRPARFLRLVKAVGLPDEDDENLADPPDLANEAFGRIRSLGMREILGYTPIEPDGSVMVKVPGDMAFSIEVLDKYGQRIGPRHGNWLQLRPGETRHCSGCHVVPTTGTPLPHGRIDAEAQPVNLGAGISLPANFPSDLSTMPELAALGGETMAQVRYGRCYLDPTSCTNVLASVTTTDPSSLSPTVDILYEDFWTDPTAPSVAANTPLSYTYADLVGVGGIYGSPDDAPTSGDCQTNWQPNCRIMINYVEHIQPLWEKDRDLVTPDIQACTSCHSFTDWDPSNPGDDVPAGQLDLTSNVSDEEADHLESYRELFFPDDGQIVNGGVLEDILIEVPVIDPITNLPVLDANGDPVTQLIPDPSEQRQPTMSANGARASFFMEKMWGEDFNAPRSLAQDTLDPNYVDHKTFMTPSELRLVAEWLDIGGQYFNNPFDPAAPEN